MAIGRYFKYPVSLAAKGSPKYLIKEISKDMAGMRNKAFSNDVHIKAAVDWILEAQKPNGDGGVAALYSLIEGWHPSYSETTGYIIPTMFSYYHKTKDRNIWRSAIRMSEWELTKQMPNGAFPGGMVGSKEYPIVFNTGQVIFGMARAFEETKEARYKDAAVKAADWLVFTQNENGCWDRFDHYPSKIHTYNVRTAWSLLQAYKITKKEQYAGAAVRNVDWAVRQQLGSGWFMHNAFYGFQEPLLHTISYTIQGILEAGILLKNEKYIGSAKKAADILLKLQRKDGSLAGSFDKNWNSSVSWSCLTGDSQTAIAWLRLFNLTGDKKYLGAAKKINDFVKSTQDLNSRNSGIRGGIKGAYPLYGWYAPFCWINWAAKFFIDALMIEEDLKVGGCLG